ncbi:transcriptional regulator [Parvibaculum sedimenti]|uniref:Transcriptional regulator n=1 Tax=Parvibaculum sedimenti TaxID=2608632 RepID=A0A6N6VKW3_9HYPH|nr:cupin-like domain-containing protein [Parvibaculum sedimenti]KAB7739611.1 transcriptional regulator [Parvibaculum sedimenti]
MTRLIEVLPGTVGREMPSRTFRLKHQLAGHSLFKLERLAKLAASLPAESTEFNGPVAPGQDPKLTPSNGLSAEETVRRIEECQSWMVIKNVEQDPEYKALLDACLDQVADQTGGVMGGARRRQAFIFVTSPNNVTPFHMDPEYNFLLQIRGSKRMSLFDHKDRRFVSEEDLEMYPGKHRNLPYRESFEAKATQQHLEPGDSIFVPLFDPHWVQNGPEVSVSFSITWHTDTSENLVKLSYVNAGLRKLGFPQRPAGTSKALDAIKVAAYDVARPLYDVVKKFVGDRRKAVALFFGRTAVAN